MTLTRTLAALLLGLFACCVFVPVTAQDAPEKGDEKPKEAEEPAEEPAEEGKQEPTQAEKNVAVLDAVIRVIRRNFYDKTYAGIDLDDLRERHKEAVEQAEPGAPLHLVLREMLTEFKVSHLTVVEKEVFEGHFAPEFRNRQNERAGFEIAKVKGGFFVSDIHHSGAAEKAGLLRGDRIVTVNGVAISESPLLLDAGGDPGDPESGHFLLANPPEEGAFKLAVQREPAKEGEEPKLVELEFKPAKINLIKATEESVTVIEYEGRRFGYIRFWHFLHQRSAQVLSKAIKETWKNCDGVIVDLRGRGGSPIVMNMCFAPFGDFPPMRGRGRRTINFNMPKWERPVVALQDKNSRSAKEVYAHNWKHVEAGPLVGEPSAGAVLGSTFANLPDGSKLLFPISDVTSLAYENAKLEGNPVQPTHPVEDVLAYAAGADVIKEEGIKVLYSLVKDLPVVEDEPLPEEKDGEEEEFTLPPGESPVALPNPEAA